MRTLIISEKSNAAARIASILANGGQRKRVISGIPVFEFEREGVDYSVVGLRGHIVELDYPKEMRNWSRTDPKELAITEPMKRVTAGRLIGVLKELTESCDEVVLATDFDREGELIGLETARMLGVPKDRMRRARFSALTKQEIERAFSDLTEPDERLADSAEARQIVDLAWGASLTRLISLASGQTGQNFLSVGRVQSPTLSLIVDRHLTIENFVPEPYWLLKAKFKKGRQFLGSHVDNPFKDHSLAEGAMERTRGAEKGTVNHYAVRESEELPPPPFNTTMLLAEANKMGMTASRAMKVAEDLYTDGFISYPRTDNTVYPKSLSLRFILERLRESEFGREAEELLSQKSIRPSRGRTQTTDHPPIHPVAPATRKKLKGDRWSLYELVTRRFMATVAPPATAEITDCLVDIEGEGFEARGYRLIREGWRKYYHYWKVRETLLPALEVGEKVEIVSTELEENMTQPPARYTQGTLIQQMERLGLGTKSTRHDIIQKLYDRKYVEGQNLIPTASGIAVVNSLEKHARTITESQMTAHLERDMERIAEGDITQGEVVKESQDMLLGVIEVMQENSSEIGSEIREALKEQRFIGKCPHCGGDLRVIRSRKGSFIGCSGYPQCKAAYPLPKSAKVETTDELCDECGLPKLKVVRRGQPVSIQCIDADCSTNKERTTLGKCPECGGDLRILYSSKSGKRFVGCSNYPTCDRTYPLYQRGRIVSHQEVCEECGSPVIEVKDGRRSSRMCLDPKCPGNRSVGGN